MLTSDLVVPATASEGIVIEASTTVFLDLNGFEITTAACAAAPGIGCRAAAAGSGAGISDGNETTNLRVWNGTISGFDRGIAAGGSVDLEGLVVRWSAGDGIVVSGRVQRCVALQNGGRGIWMVAGRVTESVSIGNGQAGILLTSNASVSASVSRGNAVGVEAFGLGRVTGSVVAANAGVGIEGATTVSECVVDANGGAGVEGSTALRGSRVAFNLGAGFAASGGSFRENLFLQNGGGTVQGGLDLGGNACNGVNLCP